MVDVGSVDDGGGGGLGVLMVEVGCDDGGGEGVLMV